eukprot:Selendium_serpulae@DN6387_c0_g1_i18.p1
MLLHENYLDFMGDVADVAEAADTFAEADRLFLGAPRSSIRRSCDRRIGEETPFGDGDRLFALTTAMGLANANLSPVNPAARQDGARQEGGGRLFLNNLISVYVVFVVARVNFSFTAFCFLFEIRVLVCYATNILCRHAC